MVSAFGATRPGGLALRVALLVAFPIILLIVGSTTQPSDSGGAALIVCALLFHWLWPLVYVGHLLGAYELGEGAVSTPELLLGALLSGMILPVAVLVPVLLEVSLSAPEHAALLFDILVLPSLWIPLALALLQTPAVLEERGNGVDHGFRASFDRSDGLRAEIRGSFLGYFCLMGIPLGAFLPIYVHVAGDPHADAVLMFFLLAVGTLAALLLVGPRLGLLAAHAAFAVEVRDHGGRGATRAVTEAAFSGFLLPVCILLPVLLEVPLSREPFAVLTAFTIALPCLALLKALHVALGDARHALRWGFALALSVFILPLGVLLPSWLAAAEATDSVGAAAQVTFLVFILGPVTAGIGLLVWYTARYRPNLPFTPVALCAHPAPRWAEILWALVLLLLPVIVLLPIYYTAVLATEAGWTVVAFLVLLVVLLATLLAVSFCVRSPSDMAMPGAKRSALAASVTTDSSRVTSTTGGISAPMEFRGPADPAFDAADLGSRHNTVDSLAAPTAAAMAAAAAAAAADPTDAYAINGSAPVSPGLPGAPRATAPSRSGAGSGRNRPTHMPGNRVPTGLQASAWTTSRRSSFSSRPPSPPPPPPITQGSEPHLPGTPDATPVAAVLEASGAEEYETAPLPPRLVSDGPWERAACWHLETRQGALMQEQEEEQIAISDSGEAREGAYYTCYVTYRTRTNSAYVLKWATYTTMQTRAACAVALQKLSQAEAVASAFNEALRKAGLSIKRYGVRFAEANAVHLLARPATGGRESWALLEPDVEDISSESSGGVMDFFCVFNDCNGGVVAEADMVPEDNPDDRSWVDEFNQYNDAAQALSCFSYFHSRRRFVLVNVQGVRGYFTNPDFHYTGDEDPFLSPNNAGDPGISAFFASFRPTDLARAVLQTLPDYDSRWLQDEYIHVVG